jgi:hypothetical protein
MEIQTLLSLILPKDLSLFFDLVKVEEKPDQFVLYLSERNIIPEGFKAEDYESKGFFNEQTIQDFPLRGKEVYLKIQRRRWRSKVTGEDTSRLVKRFAGF